VTRSASDEAFRAVVAEHGEETALQVTAYLSYMAFTAVVLKTAGLTAGDLPPRPGASAVRPS
jgi:hypothetical protein